MVILPPSTLGSLRTQRILALALNPLCSLCCLLYSVVKKCAVLASGQTATVLPPPDYEGQK